MQPTSSYDSTVTATVSSMASGADVEPIAVKAGMSMTDVDTAKPLVVYAQVRVQPSPSLAC